MSTLANRLKRLFNLARARRSPQQTNLGHGLLVRADNALPRLCLWRETGEWKAEKEGHVCASHLGWGNYTVRWQGRYLVVEEHGGLL